MQGVQMKLHTKGVSPKLYHEVLCKMTDFVPEINGNERISFGTLIQYAVDDYLTFYFEFQPIGHIFGFEEFRGELFDSIAIQIHEHFRFVRVESDA